MRMFRIFPIIKKKGNSFMSTLSGISSKPTIAPTMPAQATIPSYTAEDLADIARKNPPQFQDIFSRGTFCNSEGKILDSSQLYGKPKTPPDMRNIPGPYHSVILQNYSAY